MPSHLRIKYQISLESLLNEGFERELLSSAFDNLESPGNLRFNNFSYALRELLRHVLHRLAPDSEVKQCKWHKPAKNSSTDITRTDRATYAIQGGLSHIFVQKKLEIDVAEVCTDLQAAFDTLNKYTHIEPHTFGAEQHDVLNLATECLNATKYFVAQISECRERVAHALGSSIDEHLVSEVISESIGALDELAPHHCVDEVYTDHIIVTAINASSLQLEVTGTLGVELQYGSNSDVRNDMGAVMSDSFPFRAELTVEMERPLGKHASVDSFGVDTQSWYE